jgi:hypothetical protein
MGLLDGFEHILGEALVPLEEADRLLGEAIEKLGEGVAFAGDEAARFGEFIAGLATKLGTLQNKLKGPQ